MIGHIISNNELENLTDTTALKKELRKKAEESAFKYISENPQALGNMQKRMSRLMRKYSIVPNSNDLNSAVKRTSLSGRPFRERVYLAINLQVPSVDPFSIDFSPAIGYRINSRFIAGIGGNYRQSFTDSIPKLADAVFGYKAFINYDVIAQFYVVGEFTRNGIKNWTAETAGTSRWSSASFAGIGRKFLIHEKIESTIAVLYNFMFEKGNPIYASPWAVRIGFQASPIAFRRLSAQ